MKKKILSLIFISILVVGLTTGCGKGAQKEYSDAIKKERSSTILLLGDHNIGEYLDYVLKDYEWTEDELLGAKKIVSGQKTILFLEKLETVQL